jgi:CO/xanthine dehydrogenase FAD-binding subunit
MIKSYYRPKSIEDALKLLAEPGGHNLPLGGGAVLSRQRGAEIGVVDLQDLPLAEITTAGNFLNIGATVTLQKLYEFPGKVTGLDQAIYHEVSYNLRQRATLAGTLVSADGRSPLACAMLALDAELTWLPDQTTASLGNYYGLRQPSGSLISSIRIPQNVQLRMEGVARTPLDLPIILVAVVKWPSGRTRIVVGGWGHRPLLALDGPETSGVLEAVKNATANSGDEFGTVAYRQEAAARIVTRLIVN